MEEHNIDTYTLSGQGRWMLWADVDKWTPHTEQKEGRDQFFHCSKGGDQNFSWGQRGRPEFFLRLWRNFLLTSPYFLSLTFRKAGTSFFTTVIGGGGPEKIGNSSSQIDGPHPYKKWYLPKINEALLLTGCYIWLSTRSSKSIVHWITCHLGQLSFCVVIYEAPKIGCL